LEKRTLVYEGQTIYYSLIRKKVKNLNLKVYPDLSVVISAHKAVPAEYVERFIRSKAPWILKNLNRFEERNSMGEKGRLACGDTLYYLGRPYTLEILRAGKGRRASIQGDRICFFAVEMSDEFSEDKIIKDWYKEQGKTVFDQSMARMHPLVSGYGIEKPTITIRTMKTRWGSCSWKKGKITLNTELLKTPEACIDYVVLHELAHFRHHKHDSSFYGFLSSLMPDWKERRELLKTTFGLKG
jgi:predicted metal-dependent hydrolase